MKNSSNKLLLKLLAIVASSTALLMTSFEIVKQYIHSDISIWESHVLTIVFTTVVAIGVTYWVLKKHHSLLRILSGFIPICAYCKKIRDEKGNWITFESYIGERSEATFTHSICPECSDKAIEEVRKMKSRM